MANAFEYRVSGVWVESALVVKFTAADGVRTAGFVYEPLHNTSSWFDGLTVRGSAVVGVGETWDPADAKPEDGLVVKLDLSLTQKYRREWGAGNKTGEWFGDAVLDGKGNVFVTGDQWEWAPGGYDVARDSLGSIYVAGVRANGSSDWDILTMKHSASGKRT